MKKRNLILAVVCFAIFGFKESVKKKCVIFFGDSITAFGVDHIGYITKIDSIINVKRIAKDYELIGEGVSGNKVYDLYLRMDDDVLSKNPDAVVIWIGVNDVWHKQFGVGTEEETFVAFYGALIKKIKEKNIKLYLCTPLAIGEKNDNSNDLDGGINNYSNIIRDIAVKNSCALIDLRKEFLIYIKEHNPENKRKGILTIDGVHLNDEGNRWVAEKMYEVMKDFIK